MKKIKISKITERHGGYEVFLYPDRLYYFKSKTKAKKFQGLVSQQMTDCLYTLNLLTIEVYGFYKKNWGILDYLVCEDIRMKFDIIEKQVNRFVDSSNVNADYYKGKLIEDYKGWLIEILFLIMGSVKKSSFTPVLRNIEMIGREIDSVDQYIPSIKYKTIEKWKLIKLVS